MGLASSGRALPEATPSILHSSTAEPLQAEREEPFQDMTVPSGDIRPPPQPACKPRQVTSQFAVIPRSKAALNHMIWRGARGVLGRSTPRDQGSPNSP